MKTTTIWAVACLAVVWAGDTVHAADPDHGLAGLVHELRLQTRDDPAMDSVRAGPMGPDCSLEESQRVIDWARGELDELIAGLPDGSPARACYSDILDGPAEPARRRGPARRSQKALEEESYAFEATAKAVTDCSTEFAKEIPPPQRDRAQGLAWALRLRGDALLVCTVR